MDEDSCHTAALVASDVQYAMYENVVHLRPSGGTGSMSALVYPRRCAGARLDGAGLRRQAADERYVRNVGETIEARSKISLRAARITGLITRS